MEREESFFAEMEVLKGLADKVETQIRESRISWNGEAAEMFYAVFQEEYQEMTECLREMYDAAAETFEDERLLKTQEEASEYLPGDFLK